MIKLCVWFLIYSDEDLYSHLDSEEEYLEPPLPLISDDEWQHYRTVGPPHHYIYHYGKEINIKQLLLVVLSLGTKYTQGI